MSPPGSPTDRGPEPPPAHPSGTEPGGTQPGGADARDQPALSPETPPASEPGPAAGRGPKDFDVGVPVGPTPPVDFWQALYQRRSIRKFKEDPVPRELIDQVMHAGIWAPSSCNYQMWDLVAVDDPTTNHRLAELSSQMGNAPVNIVVSYGREFSEESWANIQSASALIQNMSLAAQVLGLGTFWITQTGDREKVREVVGLPYDRLVIAVLALGYPKVLPKSGPKRRPLDVVRHWNHYGGRPIPSSALPADWHPDDLAVYQRARVLNGLRHNKPRPWEQRALEAALERFVPEGRDKPAEEGAEVGRWLDVLPCTGILTEKLWRERRGWAFDVVERTPEVAEFVAERVRPRAGRYAWPGEPAQAPPSGGYRRISLLFRLEDLAPADRPRLLADVARWLAPDGELLLAFVSKRSFHDWTERLRARRGGPRGVEYVLSPDPNIGPFESLAPAEVERLVGAAGLAVRERLGLQAVPAPEELAFRTRNFSPRLKRFVLGAAGVLGAVERLPGVAQRFGRFQFWALTHRR